MTLVKICGTKEIEHARVAAGAGADMVGFVFVPVRREVKPDAASVIVSTVREEFDRPPAAVGLFVNEDVGVINRLVDRVGLDLVQLSGEEPRELAGAIDAPVIKAIRLQPGTTLDDARARIERHLAFCEAVLIDSHVAGQWGGTGVIGDWRAAAALASEYPVVLAGGLNAGNVARAIDEVNPAMVDVSSGVESDGVKDSAKIREFLRAASAAGRAPGAAAGGFLELVQRIRTERSGNRVSA